FRMSLQDQRHIIDELHRRIAHRQLAAAAHEADLVVHLDPPLAQAHHLGSRVRATVVVLDAVQRLGLGGALVGGVRDAVGVVVRIRAAVVVLEPVLVLGLVGALVDRVGHAVAVGVLAGRGAAVVGALALVVFGGVRAGVVQVGDAVL